MPASSLVADLRRNHSRKRTLSARSGKAAPSLRRIPLTLAGIAALLCANGCASSKYQYGRFHPGAPDGVDLQPVVVEQGGPHKTLDRIGWLAGMPARAFTLNSKASNHDVSPETIQKLVGYLEQNDLTDVYVAVNDYNPSDQWRRLRANYRVDPFWRYSAGTLSWLGYTMFPYRVFGGDEYNPFTNTLNITSDVPALVLAEAAYAKDIHARSHPGAYATASDLPVVSLFRQVRATNDVLAYAHVQHDGEGEQEAYHVLYPHIGSTTFGPAAHFVPVAGPFLSAGGALVGHAAGRTATAIVQPKLNDSPSEKPSRLSAAGATEQVADRESLRPTPESPPGEQGIIQAGYEELPPATATQASRKRRKSRLGEPSAATPE